MPKLNAILLSVQGLVENGARVTLDEFGTVITLNDGTRVRCKRNKKQRRVEVHGQALALELEDPLGDVQRATRTQERQEKARNNTRACVAPKISTPRTRRDQADSPALPGARRGKGTRITRVQCVQPRQTDSGTHETIPVRSSHSTTGVSAHRSDHQLPGARQLSLRSHRC